MYIIVNMCATDPSLSKESMYTLLNVQLPSYTQYLGNGVHTNTVFAKKHHFNTGTQSWHDTKEICYKFVNSIISTYAHTNICT